MAELVLRVEFLPAAVPAHLFHLHGSSATVPAAEYASQDVPKRRPVFSVYNRPWDVLPQHLLRLPAVPNRRSSRASSGQNDLRSCTCGPKQRGGKAFFRDPRHQVPALNKLTKPPIHPATFPGERESLRLSIILEGGHDSKYTNFSPPLCLHQLLGDCSLWAICKFIPHIKTTMAHAFH